MTPRDAQRSRLYRAESAAFAETRFAEPLGGPQPLPKDSRVAAVAAFVAEVQGSPEWARIGCSTEVRVWAAPAALVRSDARWDPRRQRLEVTPTGCSPAVVTHELAHAAVTGWAHRGSSADLGDPGHGPRFAARLLDVAGLALGSVGARLLDEAFRSWGVRVDHALERTPPLPGAGIAESFDARARARRAIDELTALAERTRPRR